MTLSIESIQAGSWGTIIRGWAKNDGDVLDISAATTKTFILKEQGGIAAAKAGSFVTDGTDGGLYYITVNGDVGDDDDGIWGVQLHIITPTFDLKSRPKYFQVLTNL